MTDSGNYMTPEMRMKMNLVGYRGEPQSEREKRWEKLQTDTRVWTFNPDGEWKGNWLPAKCETGEYGNIMREPFDNKPLPEPGSRLFGTLYGPKREAVAATFAWDAAGMDAFVRWSMEHLSGSALHSVAFGDYYTGWIMHNGFEVVFAPADNAIIVYWPARKLVRAEGS